MLDSEDVPLKQVRFTVNNPATSAVVAEVQTDNKGKYSASRLPIGTFDLKWEKSGYATVEEAGVKVAAGKELSRKIVMKAATVREGQFIPGQIVNVNLDGIDEDVTHVTVEALDTVVKVFGSLTANGGASANILGVNAGEKVRMTKEAFVNATSFMQNGNMFLNVQNNGSGFGGWRITFEK